MNKLIYVRATIQALILGGAAAVVIPALLAQDLVEGRMRK